MSGAVMLLYRISSSEVTTARRRDHNLRRIQPHSQNTDADVSAHQVTSSRAHTSSPRVRFFAEGVLLLAVVAIPFSVHAGFFSKFFPNPETASASVITPVATGAIDIPLLTALQNPNPLAARGGAEIVVDEDALVSTGPVGENAMSEVNSTSGEIRVYTVRPGDSLSQVAQMFGVTTNTIMWANDISKATGIQPGDTLVILPIVGVRHVVKSGDTIGAIAKKYDGDVDEILSYNQLASAAELSAGDTLIIPGGAVHTAPLSVAASAQPVSVSGAVGVSTSGSFSHPAPGAIKTQGIHGYNGVDLASPGGAYIPVLAAAAGEVIVSKSSGWNGGYGQYIVIRHGNGTQTLYAHLSNNAVGVGASVSQGQIIGTMGNTGKSTGTHLHFEVRGGKNPF